LRLNDSLQVTNDVIRSILVGCSHIREINLDRCLRVTDYAFSSSESPFDTYAGIFTLEKISLQVSKYIICILYCMYVCILYADSECYIHRDVHKSLGMWFPY
jgi:hypothetical protein